MIAMKQWTTLLACAAGLSLPAFALAAKPTAKEILDSVDDVYREDSAHGVMTMTVKTEHWSREIQLEMWSKGKDNSLMRILAPKKEKGTATLRVNKNIWNYLPKVKRVIKLPSSMMGGSWMGSHFTNDDLVRMSRMADDYKFEITFEGDRDGRYLYEVTCIPGPEVAVVWGKIVVEVDADKLPVRMRYFDEDLELARTMTFSEVRKVGGRKRPMLIRVQPADKPDEFTQVRYDKLDFSTNIPDDLFSLRSLQR